MRLHRYARNDERVEKGFLGRACLERPERDSSTSVGMTGDEGLGMTGDEGLGMTGDEGLGMTGGRTRNDKKARLKPSPT